MNLNFFKWVHDELVALRAAVARLETHTSSPESKPVPKPAGLPAEFGPPPPVEAKPVTGSDNPLLDAYKQSNPQHVEPSQGPIAPAVDVSAPELDFEKVQGGVPIPLPKTIVNCPDKVTVRAFITVDSGGVEHYSVTINDFPPVLVPNAQNEFESANYPEFAGGISGPRVTVSADAPGMKMQIQRA